MDDAEKRLVAHRDRLSADLQDQPAAAYFIPNHDHTEWQKIDHDEALKWVKYNHYQAMRLDHQVLKKAEKHWVFFKAWEYPDDPPEWENILPYDFLKDVK